VERIKKEFTEEAIFSKEEIVEEKLTSDNPPRVSGLPTGLPSGEAINYDNFDRVESFFYKDKILSGEYEFKLKHNVWPFAVGEKKPIRLVFSNGSYNINISCNEKKKIKIWFEGVSEDFKINPSQIYNIKFTEEETKTTIGTEIKATVSKKEIVAEAIQKGLTFEEWKKVKSFSVFGYRYIKEEETLYRVGFFNAITDDRGFQDVFVIQQFSGDEKPSLVYIGFKEDRKTATFDDIKGIKFAEEKSEPVIEEKLTTDNYKRLQRFGYEGAKFERIKHEDPNNILFRNWEDEVVIYEESGKIKGKIWEIKASTKDFDYISIEDLTELEFRGV
jgi:hypothetical protein